jgi:hypothetical protein
VNLLPREKCDRPRFTIVVQPQDREDWPDVVRLRLYLKRMGRSLGLDVLDVAERCEPVDITPHPRLEDK